MSVPSAEVKALGMVKITGIVSVHSGKAMAIRIFTT